MIEKSGYS